ncbi:hypothetical protein BDN72DRAFT_959249 [Pluteus cervinus]|uniref:Uncharacterized protein n=1 Tax=Pluteus cervinus TaxID=181527 RepID=A0ACD3AWX4_9AGAR|nr:hypothetical protein BDN72DRAFT_959249 [Pluteus cervinus]
MDSSIFRHGKVKIQVLKGERPPFNGWTSWAVDHDAQRAYVYGGSRPGDSLEGRIPNNDLYVLDLKNDSSTWERLHTQLRYHPSDSTFDQTVPNRPFPALRHSAITFYVMGGRKFLFIFGGYSMSGPTSELFAIDIAQGVWFDVPIQEGSRSVSPRLDSAIAFVGNRLYIFGGRSDFDDPVDGCILRSYSIAEYSISTQNQEWKWICTDQPYPTMVPNLGFALQVVSMPEMNRILIFPGREGYSKPFYITQPKVLAFSTDDHSFAIAPFQVPTNDFPLEVMGYDVHRIYTNPASSQLILFTAWSILMTDKGGDVVPEMWLCNPSPSGQSWKRQGLRKITCGLMKDHELDLNKAITCHGRVLFLGRRRNGITYVYPPHDATWDVLVEMVPK